MIWLLTSWFLSLIASSLLERASAPTSPFLGERPDVILFRFWLASLVFSLFFCLSWRPGFALFATITFYAVWMAVTRAKSWYVHEPVVFSDLAILLDIFRFPDLFYAKFINLKSIIAAVLALVVLIGGFFWFEPSILPQTHGVVWVFGLLLVWFGLCALPFVKGPDRLIGQWALGALPRPDYEGDIARHGYLVSFVLYALCWREQKRRMEEHQAEAKALPAAKAEELADLIIIIQSESFYDLRHLKGHETALPGLDAARSKARLLGRLQSHVRGGYTLRSEFSLLTGLAASTIGFDRFHPYLNAGAYQAAALPNRLAGQGFASHFLHPFHGHFFNRHKAIPQLGFSDLQMLDAFSEAEVSGKYVSDDAVAQRVIDIANGAGGGAPRLIFAATMENHGPWEAGRFDGLGDQVEIYKKHLTNADAMLLKLIEFLDQRAGRSVLLFYGDHVPILKSIGDPFPDELTDYVLLEFGSGRTVQPEKQDMEIHQLADEVLKAAGFTL